MQPIAYLNGEFVSEDRLRIAPQDLGFMWGVTVAEQLRTFNGQLFLLEEHLSRLSYGLRAIGVDLPGHELADAAQRVVRRNHQLIEPGSDLGLTIFVTPGLSPTYAPESDRQPTVAMHSYPLPFQLWAEKYLHGQVCMCSTVGQVPATCWPRFVKARSRLHYFLADREAKSQDPAARAILLDQEGYVNEASTANVLAFFANEGLVSPPLEDILPGISLRFIESLARNNGEAFTYRRIPCQELELAEEVFLTSTPFCVLPVARLGNREFSSRHQFGRIMKRWCEAVGVDIPVQAVTFA